MSEFQYLEHIINTYQNVESYLPTLSYTQYNFYKSSAMLVAHKGKVTKGKVKGKVTG